jgi:adenylate cyclase
LLLAGLYVTAVQFAFNSADLWLPLATPLLIQLPLALFTGLLAQYLLGRRRGKRLSKAVSYYLPEKIARELTEKELDPSSLDKLVYGVCLATDMAGFTTISERMTPDKLAVFMNDYFDTLADALKRHHVDVTEFHADSIMCSWTADNPESLLRYHPVLASLAVVDAVNQFSAKVGTKLYPRVGLEEGWFYLGHQGGGGRMGYSIVGDCANTASRHESLNKHLGTHILVSRSIAEDPGNPPLLLRPLGQFILVGKSEPTRLVEIIARRELAIASQIRLCERFAEALETLKSGQLAQASSLFGTILQDYPDDGPARFYLTRCEALTQRASLPEQLDVVLMDVK